MTNPLTPSTPAVPALPGSPALAAALADIAGGVDVFGAGVPVRVIAEARAALEAAPIRPAGRRTLFDWLRPVVAAVRNPPDRQRVEDFAGAVAAACCDLPAEIWTLEALRAGLREWKFWPSVAEVRAVVRAAAAPELARRSALRLLAAARPRPEPAPRTPPTPEQLQAVAELVASVRARLHARQAQGRTRR